MHVRWLPALTPELEREGIARDFNRQVQELRKSAGLEVSDRITVTHASSDRIAEAVQEHDAYLREELLALDITRVSQLDGGTEVKAGGEKLRATIVKASS